MSIRQRYTLAHWNQGGTRALSVSSRISRSNARRAHRETKLDARGGAISQQ
jgi:hypothetical protein